MSLLEQLLYKLKAFTGHDQHSKAQRFAAALIRGLEQRYKEKEVLFLMVLNFVNPKVAHRLPTWLYGTASSQKKTAVQKKIYDFIGGLWAGLEERPDPTPAATRLSTQTEG